MWQCDKVIKVPFAVGASQEMSREMVHALGAYKISITKAARLKKITCDSHGGGHMRLPWMACEKAHKITSSEGRKEKGKKIIG